MSIWVRRCGYRVAAALVMALTRATAIARADNPPSVDDTILDVVDSVLSEPQPHPVPAQDTPPPAPLGIPGS